MPCFLLSLKYLSSFFIVNHWTTHWPNNCIPDQQYGFLPGRSTVWQLLSVIEKWQCALDAGKCVHALLLLLLFFSLCLLCITIILFFSYFFFTDLSFEKDGESEYAVLKGDFYTKNTPGGLSSQEFHVGMIDHLHSYGPGTRFGASPARIGCDACVSHLSFHISSAFGNAIQHCCGPRCSNRRRTSPSLSFHSFPMSSELGKRWLVAIRLNEESNL